MNQIDLIILLFVFAFFICGYFRGLLRELISLMGLGGGFLAAVWKTGWFSKQISDVLPWQSPLIFITLFMLIFILINLFIWLGFGFLFHQMKSSSLNMVQRISGGFLGLFKGFLFASLLALVFSFFSFNQKIVKEKNNAYLFKPVQAVAPAVLKWTTGFFSQTKNNYPKVKDQFSRIGTIRMPLSQVGFPLQDHDLNKYK